MDTTIDDFVITNLESLGADAPIAPDASLSSLGIDSLDMAEFAQIVDEELSVKLKSEDLKGLSSVADLIALVRSRQA